jgi:hypothetical protein
VSFPSDTLYYQHLGAEADALASAEVSVALTIGGAVNEHEVALNNAHRAWTQGHRAVLGTWGQWPGLIDDAQPVLWALDNTGSGSDSAFEELARAILPRATDRQDFTLYYDKEEAELRVTVKNASTGATIGSAVTTADGTGLGRLQGSLGVTISTAVSTPVYLLIEAQALAGEVGSVWLMRVYEDETST